MKSRNFKAANKCYQQEGNAEPLYVMETEQKGGTKTHTSVWELQDPDRAILNMGGSVVVTLWGENQPEINVTVNKHRANDAPADHIGKSIEAEAHDIIRRANPQLEPEDHAYRSMFKAFLVGALAMARRITTEQEITQTSVYAHAQGAQKAIEHFNETHP